MSAIPAQQHSARSIPDRAAVRRRPAARAFRTGGGRLAAGSAEGRPAPARFLSLLAALIAIAWQALVLQPHVHPLAAAPDGLQRVTLGPAAPQEAPADCALCRQLAQAGQWLASDPPPLAVPLASVPSLPKARIGRSAGARRFHSRSIRGPPVGR